MEAAKKDRKKRGPGDGNYRLRIDGRWEVRFTLPNGKSKSLYGKTRLDVQQKHRAALRDLDHGLDLGERCQTVAQFVTSWLEDVVKPRSRAATYRHYEQVMRVHVIPELGRVSLAKLTPNDVQRLLNKKANTDLSSQSVAHIRAVLRVALNQALRWGLVTRNAAAFANPPRLTKVRVNPLSAAQARQFLEFSKDDLLGPLFAVALTTGMRQGELLGLTWEDIDFEQGAIAVRRALQRVNGRPPFVEPNSEASRRTITVPATALAALRTQRIRQLECQLAAGKLWENWGLVFSSTKGTPLDGPNVTHRLQKLLAQAGLPRQRFHDLRHACASLLLAGGVPPRTIIGVLGHSQISLTLNTYSHLSPALERDAADALDRILAG